MGFIAEALWQIKQGEYRTAAKVLSDNLHENGLNPVSKISLMEWIAECYNKCDEGIEAAKWFELASKATLDCVDLPHLEKKRKAVRELEKAIECYKVTNDLEGIKRVTRLKFTLASPTL